ncbi:Methyltransferase domain containing protein [uncultured Caudovirales phage]|uniref:Methyltransferase domain containing protein n=1 Tax=uncultured Caudovirales phage TaxID=2100421 RepID=A0A6J5MR25_9CAUD|nr:Methyltransferase domain containing protein [uncultured Caudovirales phage]
MNVDEQRWKQATLNLIERRKAWGHHDDNRKIDNVLRDYTTHLSKVFVGASVLDVGCGGGYLKQCIDPSIKYYGLDAFPVNDTVINGKIEDDKIVDQFTVPHKIIDTICAFAVMDNCHDFDLAIQNMKKIAQKNIVFLTGINIEVDQYHTFKLQLSDYRNRLSDWNETYIEELTPQVFLIEYTKP